MIHGWVTKDMEKEITSHSKYSIQSHRQVNSICTLQGNDYFAVAGTNEGLDIFEISRLGKDTSKQSS